MNEYIILILGVIIGVLLATLIMQDRWMSYMFEYGYYKYTSKNETKKVKGTK